MEKIDLQDKARVHIVFLRVHNVYICYDLCRKYLKENKKRPIPKMI